jgi:hypothetical protein
MDYPTHRRVKARKVVQGTRHLTARFDVWRSGHISFAASFGDPFCEGLWIKSRATALRAVQ